MPLARRAWPRPNPRGAGILARRQTGALPDVSTIVNCTPTCTCSFAASNMLDGVRLKLNQQAPRTHRSPGAHRQQPDQLAKSPPGTQIRGNPIRGNPVRSIAVLGFLGIAGHWSTTWLSSSKVLALAVVTSLATYFVGLVISIAIELPGNSVPSTSRPSPRSHSPARHSRRRLSLDRCSPAASGELPPGADRSSLAEGVVELEFSDGARVRIEGPAEFAARSGGLLLDLCGRLLAYVPKQARGFTVTTPTAEVIDLGTEFGLEVDGEEVPTCT